MYNRMRRVFVALSVALPLIVVLPASHAGELNADFGTIADCRIDAATGLGIVRIFPPLLVVADRVVYWAAQVHHYDYYHTTYTGPVATPYFTWDARGGFTGTGLPWRSGETGLPYYETYAYPYGYVYFQNYLFDSALGYWDLYGDWGPPVVAGISCRPGY
jgi:hypothetical protein